MKFKPSDEVTAVYPHTGGRSVLLLKVTKAGRKYLHGITLSVNPEGTVREGHETKVNLEESTIYPGLRIDLQDAEFKYRDDYRQWQHLKQNRKDEIKKKYWDYVHTQLGEWEEENPMPKPPELPPPEAEG